MSTTEILKNKAFQAFHAAIGYAEIHKNRETALVQYGRGVGLLQAVKEIDGLSDESTQSLVNLKFNTEDILNKLQKEV